MRIIEIAALSNGAHRNQTSSHLRAIPDGWAVIPDDMELKNFPFGTIETKDEDVVIIEDIITTEEVDDVKVEKVKKVEKVVGTIKVVKKWTPGVVPEEVEVERPVSKYEQLRADIDYISVMTGVDL